MNISFSAIHSLAYRRMVMELLTNPAAAKSADSTASKPTESQSHPVIFYSLIDFSRDFISIFLGRFTGSLKQFIGNMLLTLQSANSASRFFNLTKFIIASNFPYPAFFAALLHSV